MLGKARMKRQRAGPLGRKGKKAWDQRMSGLAQETNGGQPDEDEEKDLGREEHV